MQVAASRKRVIIVGGAGVFGARLLAILARDDAWDLVVAGRSLTRARAAAARVGAASLMLDRDGVTAEAIGTSAPYAVIDASGPFHMGTPKPYRLAEAAVAAGAHYLDLADGRDFVAGIGAVDAAARATDRVVLAGASTTPALSSAVCDALTKDMTRIDSIEVGVSPGNRAPRGLAVVRSILSYAGRPVRVFRGGAWGGAPGWGLLTRTDLAPDLQGRWLSLCDAPDLELFPARYGVRDRVLFRGGLELSVLHLGLTAATLLVRWGPLPSLSVFADMARELADLLIGFGTDRGGMVVDVSGADASGQTVSRRWSLVAEGGDGPNIPVLAAYAALHKLDAIAPGARPCMGEVSLPEFEALFRRFRIVTRWS